MLISKLVTTRLQSDVILYDLIHLLQFGGLKHHSTLDASFFLTEYITKAHNAGHFTSVLAVDVAQYFPSLNHKVLKILLPKQVFHTCFVNFCIILQSTFHALSLECLPQ